MLSCRISGLIERVPKYVSKEPNGVLSSQAILSHLGGASKSGLAALGGRTKVRGEMEKIARARERGREGAGEVKDL